MVPSDLQFRREPFTTLESRAAPIALVNLDTDIIIRIERLSQLPRGQLGPWAFEAIRYRDDGQEDPRFVLNQADFRDARILLTAANFGCGSSREMAVWAIQELGIRCLIGSSFGDIFRANCFQNGLLVLQFSPEEIAEMQAMSGQGMFCVDLQEMQVQRPDGSKKSFSIDAHVRTALLEGLDEIELTLKRQDQIKAFQSRLKAERPWIFQTA
jgi:3-isopropylmalate/(R)-2-methylmalate dehydratase small subunit